MKKDGLFLWNFFLCMDGDFNNDSKDAGDLGAGHTVTVFYEVIPIGVSNDYVGKIDDFHCASSVAMFGQLLRDSDFKGEADYDQVIHLAKLGLANDEHGYRKEFVRLVELVKGISAQE